MQIDHETEGIMLTRRTMRFRLAPTQIPHGADQFARQWGAEQSPNAGGRRVFCAITSITKISVDSQSKRWYIVLQKSFSEFWNPADPGVRRAETSHSTRQVKAKK